MNEYSIAHHHTYMCNNVMFAYDKCLNEWSLKCIIHSTSFD